MSTKGRVAGALGVVLLVAIVAAVTPPNSRGSAATVTTLHRASVRANPTAVLYLDIGASVSVGVQPTPRDPKGQPTNRGYSNRLVTIEAAKGITLKLTELGCPGESIATMLHGPDPCYVAPDTQLSDAVAFLHSHHTAATIVTVDLGFNTLNVCFRHFDIDLTCVAPHLALLRQQLGQVMTALTRAAGPHVVFVGLGHYNPYLTMSTKEGVAEVFAGNSVAALHQMNQSLSQVYRSFRAPMADVARAFHEEDTRKVRTLKGELTTVNVQYECRLTWMCAPKPYGPNIHPNDAGYWAIARAVAAALPARY